MIVTVINRVSNSQFTRTGDYETLQDLINDVDGTADANVFTPNAKFVNKTDNFRNIYKSDNINVADEVTIWVWPGTKIDAGS